MIPNAELLLTELEAAGLADDPLAVKLRQLRAQDVSDRRWAEGEKHCEARAGRNAESNIDVAKVRVGRRHRDWRPLVPPILITRAQVGPGGRGFEETRHFATMGGILVGEWSRRMAVPWAGRSRGAAVLSYANWKAALR